MRVIDSLNNTFIKEIAKLKDKKGRDKSGLYLIEGIKTVKEALTARLVKHVIVEDINLVDNLNTEDVDVILASKSILDKLSDAKTAQGIVAVAFMKIEESSVSKGDCLILDNLQDPKNVGAIIRTCACAGFNDVFMINCADCYSQKAVRASMSGIFKVKIHCVKKEEIKDITKDKTVVCADMKGENVFKVHIKNDVALIIGNEGNGVSDELRELAKEVVSIPMQNGMESLNAAIAGSIIMYAIINNR